MLSACAPKPRDTSKRVFASFRAKTQTFVAAGTVTINGVASVASEAIEIDIKAATIKATSFMAKSLDFATAPAGEWHTRSSMTFNYPVPVSPLAPVDKNATNVTVDVPSLGEPEAVDATSWSAVLTGFASANNGQGHTLLPFPARLQLNFSSTLAQLIISST